MKKCLIITDYVGESVNSTPYVRISNLAKNYEIYLTLRKSENYINASDEINIVKYNFRKLNSCIAANNIDFIYVQGVHNYFFAYRLAKRNKIKLVIDIFDHIELSRKLIKTQPGIKGRVKYWGYNVFYYLGKSCIRKADVVFLTLNEQILNIYPKRKNGYVHLTNGIHREIVENAEKKETKNNIIHFVYVGYVREDRGIYKIFDAIRDVASNGFEIFVDIVGPVDKNEEKNIIDRYQQLGIQQYLKLHGFKNYDDVKAFLTKADYAIYFFPIEPVELKYIYPIKILEYMAYKLPTIATAGEGIKEIARYFNKSILLCDYDSVDLAKKIKCLLKQKLNANCEDKDFIIDEKFYWENINNKFIKKIEEIL